MESMVGDIIQGSGPHRNRSTGRPWVMAVLKKAGSWELLSGIGLPAGDHVVPYIHQM